MRLVTMEYEADAPRVALGVSVARRELRARGVQPGQRVLLCAGNSAEFVLVLLALLDLDVSVALLDPRLPAHDREQAARTARAHVTITGDGSDSSIRLADLQDFSNPDAESAEDRSRLGLSLAAWREREDALIMWTSGSSGAPKAIVRSGRAFLDNLERTRARIGYLPSDVMLPLLPFSHQYGLSVVLLAHLSRCALVVAPYRRPDLVMRSLPARTTVVDATPSTYRTLLNMAERRPSLRTEWRSVRMWCAGGAPLDPALAGRFAAVIGSPLLDGYGSTEAGNICVATPAEPHGCGRPLDGVEVNVRSPAHVKVAAGETGEIWVRTPDLMAGHLNADGTFTPMPGGPRRTGDLGFFDADGALYVIGRESAVHRLGHTVYPGAVERKGREQGLPITVIPISGRNGDDLLCHVVEDPAKGDVSEWWRRICSVMAPHERPSRVVVVERLPLGRTGKTDLLALRGMVAGRDDTGRER
jgi:acyl-CoA synthetase (AMP-forming)/AMP-acid ligase II